MLNQEFGNAIWVLDLICLYLSPTTSTDAINFEIKKRKQIYKRESNDLT